MHVNNHEYIRQLSTKFKDYDMCKEQIQELKYRPEMAPHFLYNIESLYQLGPGLRPSRETYKELQKHINMN